LKLRIVACSAALENAQAFTADGARKSRDMMHTLLAHWAMKTIAQAARRAKHHDGGRRRKGGGERRSKEMGRAKWMLCST
jgi:hypothetical protein